MPTLLVEAGFRFVVFFNDHDPPHVHVFGDGKAKIVLKGPNGKPWPDSSTLSAGDLRKALRIASEHQGEFLEGWEKYHG